MAIACRKFGPGDLETVLDLCRQAPIRENFHNEAARQRENVSVPRRLAGESWAARTSAGHYTFLRVEALGLRALAGYALELCPLPGHVVDSFHGIGAAPLFPV